GRGLSPPSGFRPPAGRRPHPTGAWGAVGETGRTSSCKPARMVARDSLVASATWLMPPRPMARASTAAQRRRARSSKRGLRMANFAAIAWVMGFCIEPSISRSLEKMAYFFALILQESQLQQLLLGLDTRRWTGYGSIVQRRHGWTTPGMTLCMRGDEEDLTCDVHQGCG